MTVLEQGTTPATPADPPGHDTSSRDGWVIAAVSLAVMCFLGTLVAVGIVFAALSLVLGRPPSRWRPGPRSPST